MRLFPILTAAALALSACGDKAPAAPKAVAATPAAATGPTGAPPLDAAGVPRLRPGLFEVVQIDDGGEPQNTHECVGEEANAQMRKMLTERPSPDCKVTRSSGAAGLQWQSECRQSGLTTRLKLTVAGTDTAYKTTLDAVITAPDGKTTTSRSTAQGRWVGACPAGLEPGQTLEDQ